jgi:hypothetical protein
MVEERHEHELVDQDANLGNQLHQGLGTAQLLVDAWSDFGLCSVNDLECEMMGHHGLNDCD